jgi:hypothetical protein
MELRRIDTGLSWKDMETWSVEDNFIERVALTTIIGADTVAFLNVDPVADTASLSSRQNLERTGLGRIQLEPTPLAHTEIIEAHVGGPVERCFGAG